MQKSKFLSLTLFAVILIAGLFVVQRAPAQPQLRSPRLAALTAQLAGGELAALDRFWSEMTAQGTPLVEPIEGDEEYVLVTFLYRGSEDVRNVVVFVDSGLWRDIPSSRMNRLETTDIWFRMYRFRKDARFTYTLSVNDSLTSLQDIRDAAEWIQRSANWRADPLNDRRFPIYPRPVSVVELPGAPAQPWVTSRSGVPKGQVQTHKVKSMILSNERIVWVYSPPVYNIREPYCGVLILFDGGAYNGWIPTPTILDNLIAERRIPPIFALLVSHPNPLSRNSELTCSETFTRFLVEELIPWLRQTYHVTRDPALTVIGGSSYGGLGAAFAAFRHPEIFGNVLSQSGAFMYSPPDENEPEWLIRQFVSSPPLSIRFYLDCGLMEDRATQGIVPNILMASRHLRDVLLAKGYWVHYQEFNGGHDYINWRGTLADGLIALLRDKTVH